MPTIKLTNEVYRKLDALRDTSMGKVSFSRVTDKLVEFYSHNKK